MAMEQQKKQQPDYDVIYGSNNNGEGGGGGGLVMKLRMLKAEPLMEEQGNNNRKLPKTLAPILTEKLCDICRRGFKSGKALGGHMRRHVQESKGLIRASSLKSPKPKSTSISGATDSGGQHDCIECDKKFPSKKSLYGHMRKHPERPYRGIEPPPHHRRPQSAKNSSTSTLSDADLPHKPNLAVDHQLDYAGTSRFSLNHNPKKVSSYRGRESTSLDSQTYSESDDEEEMDMNEAVLDLMMLSQANPKGADQDYLGVSRKRKRLEVEEDDLENGLKMKHEIEDELSDSEKSGSIEKKRKKMKLEDLDGAKVEDHQQNQRQKEKVYACGLCKKSFQTHQALEGHVSSHKMLKNNISVEHDDQFGHEDTNNASNNVTNIEASQIELDQGRSHQCRVCNMSFVTGQALGGHMSSHWNGPNDQAAQAWSSQTVRRVFDFDLNEVPPMEGDEQDDHIGAGYAVALS